MLFLWVVEGLWLGGGFLKVENGIYWDLSKFCGKNVCRFCVFRFSVERVLFCGDLGERNLWWLCWKRLG